MPKASTMNFQGYLETSFRIIKAYPLILILGGLLIQLVNSVTLSLLYGPLFGGYMLMVLLLLRDNRKPTFNDLFGGFQLFRLLFPYCLVLLAKIIGFMLLIIPGFLFSTWWIYVLPLMVDRKIRFGEAMRISSDKVSETGFFSHLAFILLVYVIPVIIVQVLVNILPFLMFLTLLLLPFQVGCMVSLYLDQFGSEKSETVPTETAATSTQTEMLAAPQVENKTEPETAVAAAELPDEQTTGDDIDAGEEIQATDEDSGKVQE